MKRRNGQLGERNGFTLLELIIVLVILATVLAMAGPTLRGFFSTRQLQDTAEQILALTQFARSQAVSEGIMYRLNFNVTDRTYWLTAWQKGGFRQLQSSHGQKYTLPKDMVLELDRLGQDDQNVFVEFTPEGTATAGTIRLIEHSGRTLEVACPTVTESFYIIEREDTYGAVQTHQNG